MEQTYTIKLDSCESKPCVSAELKEVPHNRLQEAMEMAIKAFRSVEVTAEETGETIFSYYVDCDWHLPIYNYGEMIDMLSHICYDE
jgi:hypothetical protein